MNSDKNIQTLSVTFDGKVYSLNAVKKAAYKHVRAFTTDIVVVDEEIHCLINFEQPVTEEQGLRLINEFKKEVLDQDLRERLKVETESVRNVILAHAFSRTGLINNEPVSGN
jgi:His-Xaa-Ser system protein HxsD